MSMSFKASPDGLYGEILVNGQVVAKLPLTGNAVIPGLVGTVSQVGGVPTGAVVERGSNANGQYVRFADGTQICYGLVATSTSAAVTWTFPAAFVDVIVRLGFSAQGTSSLAVVHDSGPTTTSVPLSAFTSANARALTTTRGMAIGRWF